MTGTTLAAGTRGIVASMAMTGMRRMTKGLGLVREAPPDEIADEGAVVSRLIRFIPVENRGEAIEFAHWVFGGAAGAVFGALIEPKVRSRWAGPIYGLAIWALFETGAVPLLGLEETKERSVPQRLAIAADHLLYGAILTPPTRRT